MKTNLFPFLYKLIPNIAGFYKKQNLFWQGVFIFLTYILVASGFDWFYYQSTRGEIIQSVAFPAVILGFFIPVVLPIIMLLYSILDKDKRFSNAAYAIIQSALLGLGISSLYKVFTGRMGPPHILTNLDTSHIFNFGFLRNGAFQGWPSSHTSVSFAVCTTLFMLFPENKIIRYGFIVYAFYIGIGVSVNIHWFSDFIAGAILGTIIGISVGKSYLERYRVLNANNNN